MSIQHDTDRCPGCGKHPVWNLYAAVENGSVTSIIMPDPDGVLRTDAPAGPQWYAIGWPVNPHDTGERVIRMMLESGWARRKRSKA